MSLKHGTPPHVPETTTSPATRLMSPTTWLSCPSPGNGRVLHWALPRNENFCPAINETGAFNVLSTGSMSDLFSLAQIRRGLDVLSRTLVFDRLPSPGEFWARPILESGALHSEVRQLVSSGLRIYIYIVVMAASSQRLTADSTEVALELTIQWVLGRSGQ